MKQIVFIDSAIAGIDGIIAALSPDIDYFLLDSAGDGLMQIAAITAGYQHLAAIHVFSHGDAGTLYLGNTVLNRDSLSGYSAALGDIGASLATEGDLLLYGCNVAAGSDGQAFIDQLASLTDADVAASTDLTGAAILGGDMQLEATTGRIETATIDAGLDGLLVANTAPIFAGNGFVTIPLGAYSAGESVIALSTGKVLVAGYGDLGGTNDYALARYNADGSIDTGFGGGDGLIVNGTDASYMSSFYSDWEDKAHDALVQADGKILVAGEADPASNYATSMVVTRYTGSGSLDTTYGSGGVAEVYFSAYNSVAESIAIDGNGKAVLAGSYEYMVGANYYKGMAVARLNADGSSDSTFSGDGKATLSIGIQGDLTDGKDVFHDVAVQADNKIVAVGSARALENSVDEFTVVRYTTAGVLDTTFSGDGIARANFGGDDIAYCAQIDSTGKIYVAGTASGVMAVARFTSAGVLDTTFSGDGMFTSDLGRQVREVMIQSDGKILLAGHGTSDIVVLRLNSSGTLDTSFGGGDGAATVNFGSADHALGAVLQADQKILLTGYQGVLTGSVVASPKAIVARLNSDGSVDKSFNAGATISDGNSSFTEGSIPEVLDSNVAILDAELTTGNYSGATLRLQRSGGASAEDAFSATGTLGALTQGGSLTVGGTAIGTVTTNSGGTLLLTFSAGATQALVDSAMQKIAYANGSDAPPATVQIEWLLNDGNTGAQGTGGAMSVTAIKTVNITATDDDPVVTAPAGHSMTKNTTTTITGVSVNDPDGANEAVTLAVSVEHGVLSLQQTAGLSFASGDGALDLAMQFSGSESAVNSALAQLTYTPDTGYVGNDTVTFARAGGGTYAGIVVTVNNANSAPTGAASISGTATEDQQLTASNTLADADGLGVITYQWQRSADGGSTWSDVADRTTSTYLLSDSDVGNKLRVVASYTDGAATLESVASAATATIANTNDTPGGIVTISGSATEDQVLTAGNTLTDADGMGTVSYQWQRSTDAGAHWGSIGGATSGNYTLGDADVGGLVRVVGSYTDGHGTVESVASDATLGIANINDAPAGSVNISGTATRGLTLTAANTLSDVDGMGTVAYQWQRSTDGGGTWSPINGGSATGATYTLGDSDFGYKVRVAASYQDGQGTNEVVASAATATVANVNSAPGGSVTIAGTATENQQLEAGNTLSDADGLGAIGYQWQRSTDGGNIWSNIGGATNSSYVLGDADVGNRVKVVASYTDGYGTAESVASTATATVANVNDLPGGSVTISGTATENQTLTAGNTLTDADGMGTVSYQWQRSTDGGSIWNNIGGATAGTYQLGDADVGSATRVVAAYTDGHGTAESANSVATATVANVNQAPSGGVTIFGTARQGQTLTAGNTLADTDGMGPISYQWQSSSDGSTWNNAGSGTTLSLAQSLVGSQIKVIAAYTDGLGKAESMAAVPTVAVAGYQAGSAGTDNLVGTSYLDTLLGYAGADTLNGGGGNDTLDGGLGHRHRRLQRRKVRLHPGQVRQQLHDHRQRRRP
jgi:uncharacterized delta-60 repeat protein